MPPWRGVWGASLPPKMEKHMYISEQLKNGKLTTEKKKDLARSMNHSVTLQMEYDVVDLVK
jgi:hypothetical protein